MEDVRNSAVPTSVLHKRMRSRASRLWGFSDDNDEGTSSGSCRSYATEPYSALSHIISVNAVVGFYFCKRIGLMRVCYEEVHSAFGRVLMQLQRLLCTLDIVTMGLEDCWCHLQCYAQAMAGGTGEACPSGRSCTMQAEGLPCCPYIHSLDTIFGTGCRVWGAARALFTADYRDWLASIERCAPAILSDDEVFLMRGLAPSGGELGRRRL